MLDDTSDAIKNEKSMVFQKPSADASYQDMKDRVMDQIEKFFRPEFLNRLDEILLFHRLTRAQMSGIVEIQLQRLDALLAERKISLELDDKAREWLAESGYDPVYGARPLKRVIQRELQNPLAELILAGKVADGEAVRVSAGEAHLLINGQAVKAEAA